MTYRKKPQQSWPFWKSRLKLQGVLTNDHLRLFLYHTLRLGKSVLPRQANLGTSEAGRGGSLEWAAGAGISDRDRPLSRGVPAIGHQNVTPCTMWPAVQNTCRLRLMRLMWYARSIHWIM